MSKGNEHEGQIFVPEKDLGEPIELNAPPPVLTLPPGYRWPDKVKREPATPAEPGHDHD